MVSQLNRNERGVAASPHTVLIKGAWVEGQTLPLIDRAKAGHREKLAV